MSFFVCFNVEEEEKEEKEEEEGAEGTQLYR